jgi:hypothetical protein
MRVSADTDGSLKASLTRFFDSEVSGLAKSKLDLLALFSDRSLLTLSAISHPIEQRAIQTRWTALKTEKRY